MKKCKNENIFNAIRIKKGKTKNFKIIGRLTIPMLKYNFTEKSIFKYENKYVE